MNQLFLYFYLAAVSASSTPEISQPTAVTLSNNGATSVTITNGAS